MGSEAPYEFGCKVSIATPVTKPKGGQFVPHAKALHGNPYDGHTLGPVVAEMRCRAAVEPVIGHVKGEHRMERNYLKGRNGDRANAVLAAASYNFGLLTWFEAPLRALIQAILNRCRTSIRLKIRKRGFFIGDSLCPVMAVTAGWTNIRNIDGEGDVEGTRPTRSFQDPFSFRARPL